MFRLINQKIDTNETDYLNTELDEQLSKHLARVTRMSYLRIIFFYFFNLNL